MLERSSIQLRRPIEFLLQGIRHVIHVHELCLVGEVSLASCARIRYNWPLENCTASDGQLPTSSASDTIKLASTPIPRETFSESDRKFVIREL
jgi:hypothetical protein